MQTLPRLDSHQGPIEWFTGAVEIQPLKPVSTIPDYLSRRCIWTEPGEEHWRGASAEQSMTHLAIQEVDNLGSFANWGAKVTDKEYGEQQ